jgi:hypothetical protein
MESDPEISFLERTCLPFLRNAQNADGGWGFHRGAGSRTESTCWALLALISAAETNTADATTRGFRFLRAAQLEDGSWPATPEQSTGCWVTSLACLALIPVQEAPYDAMGAGLRWLCEDWPQDSTVWRRFLSRLSSEPEGSQIRLSRRGWCWTPGTSSWVEPTSLALLALEHAPEDLRSTSARRRRQLGEAMLYDRMCPGGGWNCGNPSVYGVAGEPLVVPTSLALLALRAHSQRSENVASLQWLERSVPGLQSAASLALARICLRAYGRAWPLQAGKFGDLHVKNEFLQSVQVVAWICLALSQRTWLGGLRAEVA